MDEMIGVGDQSFIDKAQRRLAGILERAQILVLASHSESIIRSFCNKALWLDKGQAKMIGSVDAVLSAYAASTPS
jgi:ABC-type polysaccharide/polyol phosphate transport system ATPase subunit